MEISEKLLCLFSAEVREADDGEYVVDIPNREIDTGSLEPGETYRVALVAIDEVTLLVALQVAQRLLRRIRERIESECRPHEFAHESDAR